MNKSLLGRINICMSKTVQRYIWSTLVTFFAGFAIVIVPTLNGDLTWEVMKSGAYLGVLFSGVRLGVKMALEGFISRRTLLNR